MAQYEDKTIECVGFNGVACPNKTFVFSAGEQSFYDGKGLSHPKRCKDCRAAKAKYKEENGGDFPAPKKKWDGKRGGRDRDLIGQE